MISLLYLGIYFDKMYDSWIEGLHSISPARWSPCHLCGKSECFLSVQSNAAASSSLKTSVVSSATQPSTAFPWTCGSVASPGWGFPLQELHFWIALKITQESNWLNSYQPPSTSPTTFVKATALKHNQNICSTEL